MSIKIKYIILTGFLLLSPILLIGCDNDNKQSNKTAVGNGLELFSQTVAGEYRSEQADVSVEYLIGEDSSVVRKQSTTHLLTASDNGTQIMISIDNQKAVLLEGIDPKIRIKTSDLNLTDDKESLIKVTQQTLDIKFNCTLGQVGDFTKFIKVQEMSSQQKLTHKNAVESSPFIQSIILGDWKGDQNSTNWTTVEDQKLAQLVHETALKNQAAEFCQNRAVHINKNIPFEWHLTMHNENVIWMSAEISEALDFLMKAEESEEKEKSSGTEPQGSWALRRK